MGNRLDPWVGVNGWKMEHYESASTSAGMGLGRCGGLIPTGIEWTS